MVLAVRKNSGDYSIYLIKRLNSFSKGVFISDLQEKMYNALHCKLKEISVRRFSQYSGIDESEVRAESLSKHIDLSFDHWLCLIMVGIPGMKVGFRVHFSSKVARSLTSKVLGESSSLSPETCHSFIGEFTNLVGGALKNCLTEEVGSLLGKDTKTDLTVPTKVPSYDEIEREIDGEEIKKRMWRLSWGDGEILCASILDINDGEVQRIFGNFEDFIDRIEKVKVDDDGDVDYF